MFSLIAATVIAQGSRLPAVRLGDQDFRPTLPTWKMPAGPTWQEFQTKLAAANGPALVEWPIEVRIVESEYRAVPWNGNLRRFQFTNISGPNFQGCLNEIALFTYLVKAYSGGRVTPKLTLVRDQRIGAPVPELANDSWSRFVISPNADGDWDTRIDGPYCLTRVPFYRFYDPSKPGSVGRAMYNQFVKQAQYRLNRAPNASDAVSTYSNVYTLADFSAIFSDDDLKALAKGEYFSETATNWKRENDPTPSSRKVTFEPGEAEGLYSIGGGLVSATDGSRGNVAMLKGVGPTSGGYNIVLFDSRATLPANRKLSFWVKAPKGATAVTIRKIDAAPLFIAGGRVGVADDGEWHRVILPLSAEDRLIGLDGEPFYSTEENESPLPIYFDDFEILDDATEPETPMLAVRPAPDSRAPDELNRLYWIGNLSTELTPVQTGELRSMIGDPSFDVRLNAIARLARDKVAEAVPDFIASSLAANPLIAEAAIEALGAIGGLEANAALKARLRGPFPHSRRFAIRALAKPGDEPLIKEFSLALAIGDIALREEAARGLAVIGTPNALRTGAAFLNDGDFRVRSAFLEALGPASPIDGKRVAQAMIEDPDPRVRAQAARALLRSESSPNRLAAAKFGDEKSVAARYVFASLPGSSNPEAKAMATRFASDSNPYVRRAAEQYLAKYP